MYLNFLREEESDLSRQMKLRYSNAPVLDQKAIMAWSFDPEGDGRQREEVGRNSSARHTKLCSRGHWRSHEDAKLKELVAQFGPQNWNLIAENLEGRTGILKKIKEKSRSSKFFCLVIGLALYV